MKCCVSQITLRLRSSIRKGLVPCQVRFSFSSSFLLHIKIARSRNIPASIYFESTAYEYDKLEKCLRTAEWLHPCWSTEIQTSCEYPLSPPCVFVDLGADMSCLLFAFRFTACTCEPVNHRRVHSCVYQGTVSSCCHSGTVALHHCCCLPPYCLLLHHLTGLVAYLTSLSAISLSTNSLSPISLS